jgi:hypothetical protein
MMSMLRSRLSAAACLSALLALAVACTTTPELPTSPSAAAGGQLAAVGDPTLKVNAPAAMSPSDGTIFENEQAGDITLEFRPATATYVNFAVAYEIELRKSDGTVLGTDILGASTNNISLKLPKLEAGDYVWQVRGAQGEARGPWSALNAFTVKPPPPPVRGQGGKRTPNHPDGGRLPSPDRFSVVVAVANQIPRAFFNSCQEHGGTWEFLDTLVDTLRLEDTRWGYAWKRGVVGDPLMDLIAYNWSSDPDEYSRKIYTIDVIGGHCGSNPVPVWNNTQPNGGPGLSAWTGRGRF